ncbi:MAG TPA: alpha/beta hydrolase [Solirubrobacteraceae bacterium]|jgi:alpha-beta hydrolase superfamily lysophospholipase
MIHETGFLTGARNRRIFWQSWRPESPPRGSVVMVHGASEHSDRYQHVAAALNGDGYAVYASDHRGHGRSEGPRALIDRLDYAVADLDQVVVMARDDHPNLPLFMLAHSMGGTVGLRYAIAHQDYLGGLILSGPLAALEAAPAPMRLAGRVLSAVAPTLPLVAIDASLISRDPAVVRAYQADPLVHHGRLPARTVAELATAIDSFPATVQAITVPTLITYGTADRLCPPAGSQMLGERIGAADKTVKPYPGLYHEIVNEPERDEVLADLRTWISGRVPTSAAAGSSTS